MVTWLQKRKLAKKKNEKMRKHTSTVAVHYFLPDPPNAMSCGVPEVAVRKCGWQRTRKHGRWCGSEVAVKKTLMKHS